MDFIRVGFKDVKQDDVVIREYYPSLVAHESQDLVIRGGQFAAIWDEDRNLYNRKLSHMPEIIDRAFEKMIRTVVSPGDRVRKVVNFDNQIYNRIMSLIRNIGDMGPELDQRLVFADQKPTKDDAATFQLPYSLMDQEPVAWNELMATLYDENERSKIEWAIGSILSGEAATDIQKFYVFYGPPGSGKSTVMNIIEMLFEGHTAAFSAYDLGQAGSQFSLEPFAKNPMVAIDQDGDLSKLEINKNLNLIASHDKLLINSKGKNLYPIIPRTTLFIGSNSPVKISDRKSGIFRRLVDINPTGNKIEENHYNILMGQVKFELGAIANQCLATYENNGATYLSSYRSTEMMFRTNDIFNFVEDNRLVLQNGITLKLAHKMYGEWCQQTETKNVYKQFQFRDLLKDYFDEFHEQVMIDGERHRSWFHGLKELEKFSWKANKPVLEKNWLDLGSHISVFDEQMAEQPAQMAVEDKPGRPWERVTTTLADVNTKDTHYVQVPPEHIVLDFDLKGPDGEKSLERNLAEARKFPPTYAEVSKSGKGIHLHYNYTGDPTKLASISEDGLFEIKVQKGNASLRRKLSLCNILPIAPLASGLPLKEDKVLGPQTMKNEKTMRDLIVRALNKQIHPHTKSNMDFIEKVLKDAFRQGMAYDVSDMWPDLESFAMSSSNQMMECLEILVRLQLRSEDDLPEGPDLEDKPIAIFDLEIYPNLFTFGYMVDQDDAEVVVLINPSAQQIQDVIDNYRLVGFYNRLYDNHMVWAATLGYTVEELYNLSQRLIVHNDRSAYFGAGYNLAYADLYDIATEKKSLKKWEVDLDLTHKEMDIPWDKPVKDEDIPRVVEYMKNDIRQTRAVKKHLAGDWKAREILAALTGKAMCNTNKQHTEQLIFGNVPWDTKNDLVYTDLREMFPGYEFDQFKPAKEKSTYRGVQVGEGGYVEAKPGMYENVYLFDVASMHPTSIIQLNLFGQFTSTFEELVNVRLNLKQATSYYRKGKTAEAEAKIEETMGMFGGRLRPFLDNPDEVAALADALKIVINSVYGLTAASFPNKFKDDRNIDNIVAKRGALFMIDLRHYLEEEGYNVIHIKTDSVKVVETDLLDEKNHPRGAEHLGQLISDFGDRYGYTFEHEATYDKFCLVNDAVYVCREGTKWDATGKQFQHPIVFKTLFSGADFEPKDYSEVRQVAKGHMYLVSEETNERQFVGKFGAFVPVIGGRILLKVDGDKEASVTESKDWRWELLGEEGGLNINFEYYTQLVDKAKETIGKFGDFKEFVS